MADKFVNENNAKTLLTQVKGYVDSGLATKQENLTFDSTPTTGSVNPVESGGIKTYVDDRFDGASKAISFANYSAMITEFNSLADDAYGIGQDVYIVTTEVPDLWVSSVESISVPYTYVDDATFISDLNTNGYVQVGYYRLSALETQKVDLTNYVNLGTETQTFTEGKILQLQGNNKKFTIKKSGGSGSAGIIGYDKPVLFVHNGISQTTYGYDYIDYGGAYEMSFPNVNSFVNYRGTLALIENIFPAFSTSNTYAVGDLVTYNKSFYRCTTAVTVAGAWNSANWTATTLEAEVKDKASKSEVVTLDTTTQTFTGSKQLGISTLTFAGSANDKLVISRNQYIESGKIKLSIQDGSNEVAFLPTYMRTTGTNLIHYPTATGTLALTSDIPVIFPDFSTSSTYAVGDLVTYNNLFYKCTTAVTIAGAWDANNWTQTTLEAELKSKQFTLTTSSVEDGTLDKVIGFDSNGDLVKGTVTQPTPLSKYDAEDTVNKILYEGEYYSISSVSLTDGEFVDGNWIIPPVGTAEVLVAALEGYKLPSTITVTGASYTWDDVSGKITLSNPTAGVEIIVQCERLTPAQSYNVVVDNIQNRNINLYDGQDANGTFLGTLNRNTQDTVVINSGYIYVDDPSCGFKTQNDPGGTNPYAINGDITLTVVLM